VLVVLAILGAALVFVIAAVVVGRETFRLGHAPPPTIVDVDEAVAYVAENLDEEHASRLTFDEVRSIVGWYLAHLRGKGVSALPGEEPRVRVNRDVVIDDDAVAAVLGAADDVGLDVTDDDVVATLDLVLAYFVTVGAVGPPVGWPDPKKGGGPPER
jgi:hypothetical protein